MLPAPTDRLRFREMTEADIDLMAHLLGGPAVMRFHLAQGPIGESYVVAIINPANIPSRRVAEKLGMQVEQHVEYDGLPAVVYAGTAAPT